MTDAALRDSLWTLTDRTAMDENFFLEPDDDAFIDGIVDKYPGYLTDLQRARAMGILEKYGRAARLLLDRAGQHAYSRRKESQS